MGDDHDVRDADMELAARLRSAADHIERREYADALADIHHVRANIGGMDA